MRACVQFCPLFKLQFLNKISVEIVCTFANLPITWASWYWVAVKAGFASVVELKSTRTTTDNFGVKFLKTVENIFEILF